MDQNDFSPQKGLDFTTANTGKDRDIKALPGLRSQSVDREDCLPLLENTI